MTRLSVMHQAKHVRAYERFLMQLAWETLLERHHRLEQGLCPNVFTANYVVASHPRIKSNPGDKNTLAPHDPHTMSVLLVWFS